MSKLDRRQRRNLLARPLAVLLVVSMAAPLWAAPGDITTIPAPMLGSDPPKAKDISDGDASVSTQTGALSYSYPITVPPGRLGMQPSLSLSYSSQAPIYGGVASGWSLSIPEIRLDTSESVLDMLYGSKRTGHTQTTAWLREKYISTLSGSRPLVVVTEPSGVAADVRQAYRAANDDSYVRYERLTTGSTGLWRARTPDGLTHVFGEALLWVGGSKFAVPLTSTEDSYGNRIEYEWLNQQIVEIRYTSNVAASLPAFAKVQFDYIDESCPGARLPIGAADDLRLGTKEGARKLTTIRAVAVDSAGATQHTREYTLRYEARASSCTALHGPQRVLISIQESAWVHGQTPHTDLPAVTFAYNRLERTFDHVPGGELVTTPWSAWSEENYKESLNAGVRPMHDWNGLTAMMLDFNGDGLLDRIENYPDANECRFTWAENLGRRPPGDIEFALPSQPITMPRLPWKNGTRGTGEACYLNYQVTRVITPGFGGCQDPPGSTHLAYRWLDMTSDGLPDLVAAIHHDNHFDPNPANAGGIPYPYEADYFQNLRIPAGAWPACTGGLPDGGACPALSGACLSPKLSCLPGAPCDVTDDDLFACVNEAPPSSCGLLQKSGGTGGQKCMSLPGSCYLVNPNDSSGIVGCTHEDPHERCDRFPWMIYENQGGGSLKTGVVKLQPAPLESEATDSPAGGGGAVVSPAHAITDIDGDGHLDMVLRGADFAAPYQNPLWWVVFRGTGTGEFVGHEGGQQPYTWLAPHKASVVGGCGSLDGYCGPNTLVPPRYDVRGYSSLIDLNGDGALDYAWSLSSDESAASTVTQGFFNLGSKFRFYSPSAREGDSLGASINWLTRGFAFATDNVGGYPISPWDPEGRGPLLAGWKSALNRPFDIDMDGRVDVAWSPWPDLVGSPPTTAFEMDPRPSVVHMNAGGTFQPGLTLPSAYRDALVQRSVAHGLPGRWGTRRDLIDMDGDGLAEHWNFDIPGSGQARVSRDASDQPLRLLRAIDNGRGGSVEIKYAPTTDSAIVQQDASLVGAAMRKALPHSQWVVKSLKVSDRWDTPDASTTAYAYKHPIWNRDERDRWGFRGFEEVATTLPSNAKVVDTYGFDVDWSGRLKASKRYEAGAALTHPRTISETTWAPFSLLGNALKTYHATAQHSWTCNNGQSELACKAANSGLNWTSSIWTAQNGQLWTNSYVYKLDGPSYDAGDRYTYDGHTLYSNATAYRLRQHSHAELQQTSIVPWTYAWATYQETYYDAAFKQPMSQSQFFGVVNNAPNYATRATTMWDYDPATGVKLWTRNPRNHDTGPVEEYGYDVTKRFVTSVKNERNQITTSGYEPGTGAQLWTQGLNGSGANVEKTWTDIDGLGRPTAGYVNRSPGSGAWVKTQVSRTKYTDSVIGGARTMVVAEGLIDYGVARWTREETRLDGQGRPTQTLVKTGATTPDAITTYDYDYRGHLVEATLPDPQNPAASVKYTHTFDSLGRPTGQRRPAIGSAAQTGVNLTYDGLTSTSEEVAVTGPTARKVLVKDNFGRLTEVREYTTASAYATTFYLYDVHDMVARIQNPDGVVTELVQDLGGRRTRIVRGGRTWSYVYKPDGQMESETVPGPAGASTNSYAYDELGRLTSRTIATRGFGSGAGSDADLLGVGTIAFEYDTCANGKGRLCTVTHASNRVKTQYDYDSEGNPASTTRTFNFGGLVNVARVATAKYGPGGRVASETYADNKIGETTATGASYVYDDRAKPQALIWNAPGMAPRTVATQTRNVAGLVTSRVASLHGTPGTSGWRQFETKFTYDRLTRVESQTVKSASNTAMTGATTHASQTLGYYGMDDPSTLTHAMGGVTYNFTFGYDAQHQLTTVGETGGKYNATFAYGVLNGSSQSGSGKLRQATVGPTTLQAGSKVVPRAVTYQYDTTGSTTIDPEAPTALVNTVGGAPVATYTYETTGTGNLATSKRIATGATDAFAYDGEDQLRRSVRTTGATTNGKEEYYYDHTGQRVGVVTRDGNGAITGTRLFVGGTEIELAPNGTVTQAYAYLSMGTPVAKVVSPVGGWASTTPNAWTNGASVVELQYHGLSSNTLLSIDPTGTVKAGFVYAPYGDVVETSGPATAAQRRRFNDKFQDDLTSLTYYGVRYYDGLQLGWTQADPLYRFVPDTAWSEPRRANLYQFVAGNPLRYRDPDGRDILFEGSMDQAKPFRAALQKAVGKKTGGVSVVRNGAPNKLRLVVNVNKNNNDPLTRTTQALVDLANKHDKSIVVHNADPSDAKTPDDKARAAADATTYNPKGLGGGSTALTTGGSGTTTQSGGSTGVIIADVAFDFSSKLQDVAKDGGGKTEQTNDTILVHEIVGHAINGCQTEKCAKIHENRYRDDKGMSYRDLNKAP